MKTFSVFAAALAALLLSSPPAAAQVDAGMHEVGIKGSFDRGNQEFTVRTTRIDVDGYYGLSVTDRIAIGPAFTFSKVEREAANWALSGFVDVYLGKTSSRAVPFVEAAYGQRFGDERFGVDPTFASIGSGVKWFFGDGSGALNMNAFYRRQFFDVGAMGNFATGIDEFGIKVGVAIYSGR
jgi:hypothetical protein